MKALLRAWGLISLLGVEVWMLWYAFLGSGITPADVVWLLGVHLAATLGFAFLAGPRVGRNRLPTVLFIAATGLFVPVVGLLGSVAALRLSGTRAARPARRCSVVPMHGWDGCPATRVDTGVSVSRLRAVLASQRDPEERIAALLAAGSMGVRNAIGLYKIALRDPVDEVRLLAFSKLEGHRRGIEGRIAALRAALELRNDEIGVAALHHRLAEAHDDLAYLGLVEGDALRDALTRAADHARIASRTESSRRGAVFFTLGRILCRAGALEQAQHAFEQARACGISPGRTAPYSAEIAFKSRNFARVRAYMRLVGAMRSNRTPMRSAAALWR